MVLIISDSLSEATQQEVKSKLTDTAKATVNSSALKLKKLYEKISAYHPTEENLNQFKTDLRKAYEEAQITKRSIFLDYEGKYSLIVYYTGFMICVANAIDVDSLTN